MNDSTHNVVDPVLTLRMLFDSALKAVDPATVVPKHLPAPPSGRIVVIGAGKASAAMALATERHYAALGVPVTGVVVTRYGHTAPCSQIRVIEAAHPVPDGASTDAVEAVFDAVRGLNEDDLVISLMSGGGSALLSCPAVGLTLEDKQQLTRRLLASGASIEDMNTVRMALSGVKGGRLLAKCHPAHVLTLVISDIPSDNPAFVASGPTVLSKIDYARAIEILDRYGVPRSDRISVWLRAQTGVPFYDHCVNAVRCETKVVANATLALKAAVDAAQQVGLAVLNLGGNIEGDSDEVAKVFAGIAHSICRQSVPMRAPCVVLSGGETTVSVKGAGRGGRNVQFLLALGHALGGAGNVYGLSADTDGIDGIEDSAGAILMPDSLKRAAAAGRDPAFDLRNNDAHSFFESLGNQIITGPTRTNVNDFRAVMIL
jgi:glycerate 2-kinase